MTRKISFITGVAGAALVLAAPAFGKGQLVEQPQWQQALNARGEALNQQYQLGDYSVPQWQKALVLRSEGLNRAHGIGGTAMTTTTMLDARERALVRGVEDPYAAIDARERALVKPTPDPYAAINARERSFDVKQVQTPTAPSSGPVVDDRFRIDPSSVPTPVSVSTSDDGFDWPHVGIGFGVGIVLALGLLLALRATRIRPLAH